jgi:PAS domain S-box-containing protein
LPGRAHDAESQRLAAFARIGSDWLWETDAEGRFSYFSVEVTRGGIDLGNRIGMTRGDVAVADAANAKRIADLDAIFARREPFRDFRYVSRNRDGDGRWCQISGEPVLGVSGEFLGYRGVGRDVTELVAAQAGLEAKSQALDAILAATPDGVRMIDGSGRTVAINPQIFEITETNIRLGPDGAGSMFDAMLDNAKRGEYGPGDPQALATTRMASLKKLIDEGRSYTYQRRMRSGRWFEGRLRPQGDGSLLMLYRDITDDKRREAELEQQSALLATMLENLDDGISIFDANNRLVLWNDRFPHVVGLDPALLYHGAKARDLLMAQVKAGEFGPGDPDEVLKRRIEEIGRNPSTVYERVRPDGTVVEVRRYGMPDGGAVSIYLDVTKRKRAEVALQELNATLEHRVAERTAALAESERFQRNLVASVPGLVYRCRNDRDWTMEFVSRGCRALLGIEPDELTSGRTTYNSLVHPDDRELVWDKVQADFGAGETFTLEYRVRHADDSWRWVWDRARAIRDEAGAAIGMEGLILDIEDRKQAEQAARKASDTLLDAMESVNNNLIIWDRDDRLVMFTRHLYEQYPDADKFFIVGNSFAQIFREAVDRGSLLVPPGEDKEQFIAERIALHQRADGRVTSRQLRGGGTLHISEHRSQSGGIVAIGRDVTEQLKVERQLREAQRMEAIGQLTGGLAHDLNNYLAVIMGNLDLLAEIPQSSGEALSLVEGAIAGAERGAELTRSLLAFSRRQPLAPRVLDVSTHIRALSKLIDRTIGERIAVELDVPDGLWRVAVDGAQLDSALVNLANNARDAMPNGGGLRISARNVAGADGDRVMIEVTDDGIGMDGPTRGRAFEPFFSTKPASHGTGLGLSMVHGFVHQSGGTIEIESSPGRGTTVRLFLPRVQTAEDAAGQGAATSRLNGGSERILVVEDNDHVRETVAGQLRSLGYRIVEAESGDEALRVLESDGKAFDLVLSDMVMPGRVDGGELARQVSERWPDIAVLLTSGFAGDPATWSAIRVPVLRKPYRKAELAKAIRAVLAGESEI